MPRTIKVKDVVVLSINYDYKVEDGPPISTGDDEMWQEAFERFILSHDWGNGDGVVGDRVGNLKVKVIAKGDF